MSVYVGIDLHRKRSQVAVIDSGGEVLANRNVPDGAVPILGVIGGLQPGTPAAFEAAFGWGWLLELLEDYGFDPHLVHPLQCKAIASARLKNGKGRCDRPPPRQEDRHHRDRPQAADPRLAPAHRRRAHRQPSSRI